MAVTTLDIPKYQRKYLQPDTTYDTWTSLQDYVHELDARQINSVDDLALFLEQMNELEIVLGEQDAWNSIKFRQYTNDEKLKEKKQHFEKNVWEKYELVKGKLRQKLLASPFLSKLIEHRPELQFMMQEMQVEQRTFSEKNAAIESEISKLVDEHSALAASMRVTVDGEEMSAMPAIQKRRNPDRNIRKAAHLAIQKWEEEAAPKFHTIFDKMVQLRHKVAHNAGYKNYRDYMWDKRKKIYYSPEEAEKFCHALRDYIMPVYRDMLEKRRKYLGFDKLMPWDMRVELGTDKPITFFEDDKDLLEKVKTVYHEIRPELSEIITLLEARKLLDFEIRENKANSMFSCRLSESKLSFVFMNASDSAFGVSGTFHETTHAIHNFYNHDKDIPELKRPAVEANELFTIAMEMILADYWTHFLDDETHILSAKLEKLNSTMIYFRMFTLWDRFQHWAYLHPDSSGSERDDYWKKLTLEYGVGEEYFSHWHQRPLIFIAPFYMLDYAFATLGAAAIYMNYRKSPKQTIENMIAAMKLGNTASLQDIFKTAGINFDFSEEYVAEIADFLREEYDGLFEQLV